MSNKAQQFIVIIVTSVILILILQPEDSLSDKKLRSNKNYRALISDMPFGRIGPYMKQIRDGDLSVSDILSADQIKSSSANDPSNNQSDNQKPPMEMAEIIRFLNGFIKMLHDQFTGMTVQRRNEITYFEIWDIYFKAAEKVLYPWDREYLERMPPRRQDDTIFLSLASYRDENCINTITEAYSKAKNPEKLNVGLVQQNCVKNCKSGILDRTGRTESVPADDDCYQLFCSSEIGKEHCEAGRVRHIFIEETESLGPYAARYFASKLWNGEQWYMQIDAHMFFLQDWDRISVKMLQAAPSNKPVISHYPPPEEYDFSTSHYRVAPRLCGPIYANSDLESQIIRLEGSFNYDTVKIDTPRFAPFIAAGYFVAHSDCLREVPYDPFLPWIFMGEETSLSARLWTSGYDIFSPSQSVTSHKYGRRKKPKFWESVHRLFRYGIHNPLQELVLERVKYQLGYPESDADFISPQTVLAHIEEYGMGKVRSLEDFLYIGGLNMKEKRIDKSMRWCETGVPPPGKEQFNSMYETAL